MNLEEQETYFRFCELSRDPAQTTQRFPATGEPPSVPKAGEDDMQSSQQNSGVPKKKEVERTEFEKFPNSFKLVRDLEDEFRE